jgi:GTP-binding protein
MLPLVAIVGRPNVGKSTLFNRLVRRRSALVADEPGLTRDRHYARTEWDDIAFDLVDTGGFELAEQQGAIEDLIRAQTETAIEEADVVILVCDARDDLTATDRELSERLHRVGKPLLVAANKIDGPKQDALVAEMFALGFKQVFGVSAEHGRGMDALLDALLDELKKRKDAQPKPHREGDDRPIRIALVGRPNAGKSALLNRLCGAERAIVSDVPGTTRDPVDVELTTDEGDFVVVDTAGIRRKRRSGPVMEQISVIRALRAVTDADVVCLVIDGTAEVAAQEARIANRALQAGRGLVLVFSKSDLYGPLDKARKRIAQQLDDKLHFVDFAPHLLLSSKTGKGVAKLLPTVKRIYAEGARRISTSELNRFLEAAVASHHPPAHRGRLVRLYYITQPETNPPTFIISVNTADGVTDGYRRFLLNRLRGTFGFEGVPLRVFYRERKRSESKKERD